MSTILFDCDCSTCLKLGLSIIEKSKMSCFPSIPDQVKDIKQTSSCPINPMISTKTGLKIVSCVCDGWETNHRIKLDSFNQWVYDMKKTALINKRDNKIIINEILEHYKPSDKVKNEKSNALKPIIFSMRDYKKEVKAILQFLTDEKIKHKTKNCSSNIWNKTHRYQLRQVFN